MKKLIFAIVFLLPLFLQGNAQETLFPSELIGYDSKPNSPLFGQVKTVLTMSYRGEEVSNTTVETYSQEKKKQEFMSQNVGIETHSGKVLSLVTKKSYVYNENLSKILSYETDGAPFSKKVFNYDTKRRLLEEIGYSTDNKIFNRITYEYDIEKREVTATYTTYYKKGSLSEKIILSYNEKGQWIQRISFDKHGKKDDSISFEYDENGFLVKVTTCCKYNFSKSYNYKFDNQGNWIEKVEFYSQKDNKGNVITRETGRIYRVVSYYSDIRED